MLALSLVPSNGCPPALVLYQEQVSPKAIQDLQPFLSNPRSRPEMIRSTILSLAPYEHDDLFKIASGFHDYGQFVKSASITRMPLVTNLQEYLPDSGFSGFSTDERWAKYQQILQFLSSRSSGLKADCPDPCLLPNLSALQAIPADVHLQHTDFEFNRFFGETTPRLQEADHDIPWSVSVHHEGQVPFVGNMADMKDLASVYSEFALLKDAMQWRKQNILVPHFRWNHTVELQDHIYPSSLKLDAVTAAPLRSPEKVNLKTFPKRKSKKSVRERDPFKSNSVHACESLLSLIMDKKRNGKSVLNSLKKSGPELPQLLTQFSASIAGTGLAVIFSVLYKMASGTTPFCTSNVLTSGFGIGLFWLSWAVNNLRNTIIYINKNSAKLCFEEKEMMMKVDKSVKDIFFRAAASMAVLMLRFS